MAQASGLARDVRLKRKLLRSPSTVVASAVILLEMAGQSLAGLLHRVRVQRRDGAAGAGDECGGEDGK